MLSWKARPRKADELYVVLEGDLTEGESLGDLHVDETARLVLNMARVRYVNSEGSRRLLRWLEAAAAHASITAELCSPVVVDLINMVPVFADLMRVESVIVPIECPECMHEDDLRVHVPVGGRPAIELPHCPECDAELELAVLEDRYFAFLDAKQPRA